MANDRTNMVSLMDFGKWMGGTATNLIELGDGFTEITEDWAPNMEEKQYVNMKNKTNTLNGYALSINPEREHLSDDAQKHIDESFRKFPTGAKAETDYYRFYKTDKIEGAGMKYKAIKVPIVAGPASTGGAGGESLKSSIQITGNGEVTEGTITVTATSGKLTYAWEESAGAVTASLSE